MEINQPYHDFNSHLVEQLLIAGQDVQLDPI